MNILVSETSLHLRQHAANAVNWHSCSEAGREQQDALKQWVDGYDQVDCYLIGPPDDSLTGISGEYRSANPVTAWLCRGLRCLPPVNPREELQRQLEN